MVLYAVCGSAVPTSAAKNDNSNWTSICDVATKYLREEEELLACVTFKMFTTTFGSFKDWAIAPLKASVAALSERKRATDVF
jgi:hypothetical protein